MRCWTQVWQSGGTELDYNVTSLTLARGVHSEPGRTMARGGGTRDDKV